MSNEHALKEAECQTLNPKDALLVTESKTIKNGNTGTPYHGDDDNDPRHTPTPRW